ncbi:MAG: DNA replication and repair protein RecF [Bacteroidota bacterium]
MTAETIHLRCFRNHKDTEIEFCHLSNILIGKNGEGKTNVLEAISYLCLTKSFFGARDTTIVMIGETSFSVQGIFTLENGHKSTVRAEFTTVTNEKNVTVNNIHIDRKSNHIGQFPVVVLSPEHAVITFGGPAERRRFIDLAIAQTSNLYLNDILEYRKVIRQRNTVLADARAQNITISGIIETWNDSLLQYASRIIHRRRLFLEQFSTRVVTAYQTLTGTEETPRIEYISHSDGKSIEEIRLHLEKELYEKLDDEIRIGTTLVGPQRDEIRFTLNGQEIRKYASQGQHKTFLIALKMAEFCSLKDMCRETPIVLLDDVFSELDGERTKRLMDQITTLGQTFITTTENSFIERWSLVGRHITKIDVKNGTASYVHI